MSVYFSGYPWSRCCEIIMRLPKRWISGTVNILICATEDRRFGEKLLDGVSVAVAILRADLETRTIAAKLTAKTYMKGIDHSPTPYFGDSPAWMKEGASEGCIASCQASKVGVPFSRVISAQCRQRPLARRRLQPMTTALGLGKSTGYRQR
jgi:hypothetical protein